MSLKNRDEHNRWRNKTVAFRVSPEEWEQIERYVRLSGLNKQDYITRRLTHREITVQGKENVTESLKATDQMAWVQKMNNIRNRATEIVNAEMIYTV